MMLGNPHFPLQNNETRTCVRVDFKGIKYCDVRPETLKRQRVEKMPQDSIIDKYFLERTLVTQKIMLTTDK